MGQNKKVDNSRMMGTGAFKKEINHLLYSQGHTDGDGEYDPGWNSRDHALVMALLLKRGNVYPKITNGKCMFVQGPIAGNPALGIGQESTQIGGHTWIVDPKFGIIDLSPTLERKPHHFRAHFNGVFNRVWLPPGKERVSVLLCHDAPTYDHEIKKAGRAMAHSTAVYLQLDEQEVTDQLVRSPFKFLNSRFSAEIKKRFGPDFYPAVAKHLHGFMLGKRDSLMSLASLKAWGIVVDELTG